MLLNLKYHKYNINRTIFKCQHVNIFVFESKNYALPRVELLVVVLRPRSCIKRKMENLHIHTPRISTTIDMSLYVIDTVAIGTAPLGLIPDTHTTELPFRS